jgi:adenine C2-methylase RlmN of 23S rRNA A2503 and tRNA A37
VEYVVIGDVNDRPEHAHELGQLLRGRKVVMNLIPYNPSDVPENYQPPKEEDVFAFRDICMTYGLFTTVRVPAACCLP